MTSGHDAGLKGQGDRIHIFLHRLAAGQLHLFKDVVVAAGDQNAGFPDAQVPDELEVFLGRADPGGDFREAVAQILAAADGLAVLGRVYEKLSLADDAVGTAQTVHIFVEIDDLIDGVRIHRLLSVAEGSVCDPDLFGHVDRDAAMVERDLGNAFVIVDVTVEIGFGDILKGIPVCFLLKQVGLR